MIYHIDMSNHYNQKNYSVIAVVSVNSKNKKDNSVKKAIVITEPFRSKLLKDYSQIQLHAAIVSLLIEDLIPFKIAYICPDIKPIDNVISYICQLHPELVLGHFKSLNELREGIGDMKYCSEADAFARNVNRNFNRRKNRHRRRDYFDDDLNLMIVSYEHSINGKKLIEKLRRFIESNR
ncbi:MAG: hypothetical protein ACMXX5_02245 [Candidatus Woesearchaeota archaeon]